MAEGVGRKVSAASARAHTRKSKQNTAFQLPSGMFKKLLMVSFMGILALAYRAIQPPPPRMCGSSGCLPVTAPRIRLSDGRHLAYKEHGVPKDEAKYKIVYVHGTGSSRHEAVLATKDVMEGIGVYIVSFDRPGYGDSDPNPKQTLKSSALDIEELADQLGLGSKFYVIGFSMGGQAIWRCLKYIPHRLAGASLIAPAINFWWPNLPRNLSKEAFDKQLPQDQWAYRISHYIPWLTYWWNTQKLFPSSSVVAKNPAVFTQKDLEIMARLPSSREHKMEVTQQGEFESLHRDLMVGFGTWDFDPVDLENPFPNSEGSIQLWQGNEDLLVPVSLQNYIAQQLPWIHYYEVLGAGHFLPFADGMADAMLKALLTGETTVPSMQ
ncbi:2,6-dioxo-6-phenylhexa-3-enoate hydrolase [Bertholletia excelsa]